MKLGFISSETGVAAANFVGADKAARPASTPRTPRAVSTVARSTSSRSTTSRRRNINAAKDLVENQNVFTVVNDSPFAFLTYRYLVDAKVPMIGGGFDGSYYYDQGNEYTISSLGDGTPSRASPATPSPT